MSVEWIPAGSSHGCHRCYPADAPEGQSEFTGDRLQVALTMPVGCSTQRQNPKGPNSLLDPDWTPPELLQPKDPGFASSRRQRHRANGSKAFVRTTTVTTA